MHLLLVSQSTLFNSLVENGKAQAANYPFCTIEPSKREGQGRWDWWDFFSLQQSIKYYRCMLGRNCSRVDGDSYFMFCKQFGYLLNVDDTNCLFHVSSLPHQTLAWSQSQTPDFRS